MSTSAERAPWRDLEIARGVGPLQLGSCPMKTFHSSFFRTFQKTGW